jgi:two-component system sensor histidine kinase UhpB
LNALIEQLEANNTQLRAISQRVIHAQEEERRRIARTLHDDTGQALTMLIINLERMEKQLPPSEEEIKARLATARQLAAGALEELRKTVRGLRPAILDDLGLAPAMRWYARSMLGESGMQVEVEAPEEPIPMPPEMTTTLFRIAQEAVNNIQRHSQAKKACISLRNSGGEVYLRIEDDGGGFQVPQTQGEAIRLRHWGLVNIQEWAELVGGSCTVSSEPGEGTLVEVTVPLPKTAEAVNG